MAKKMLKRDWEGRYVRLKVDLQTNGGDMFKIGDVMKVRRNYGGLSLVKVVICKDCLHKHLGSIRSVHECRVTLLPKDYFPDKTCDI